MNMFMYKGLTKLLAVNLIIRAIAISVAVIGPFSMYQKAWSIELDAKTSNVQADAKYDNGLLLYEIKRDIQSEKNFKKTMTYIEGFIFLVSGIVLYKKADTITNKLLGIPNDKNNETVKI